MKRRSRVTIALGILIILSLILSACQSAPAPAAPKAEAPKAEAPAKPADAKPAAPAKAEAPAKPAEAPKAEAPKPEAKPAAKEPYKLGLIAELSGPVAGVGLEYRDGIVLEVERANAAGGVDGHRIDMVIEDDGAEPTKGATAVTKLTRQDQVLAIIGPAMSGLQSALRPLTERDQVTQLLPTAGDAETRSKNYKWSFNVNSTEAQASDAMMQVLKARGYKKVAIVNESGPLYFSILDAFKADTAKAGIQVVQLQDTFNMKDVDVTPQITKLKDIVTKDKPEAVVIIASGFGTPTVLKAMRQLGVDLPPVGIHIIGAQAFLDLAGPAANGISFASFKALSPDQLDNSDPAKPLIVDYLKRYKAKYNKDIQYMSMTGAAADATNIVLNALKIAGADRAKIRDTIEKTSKYQGLMGIYSFSPDDHEGPNELGLSLYTVKDGKFVFEKSLK